MDVIDEYAWEAEVRPEFTCEDGGVLAPHALSVLASGTHERHWGATEAPVVCRHLRCGRCGAAVSHRDGVGYATAGIVSGATLDGALVPLPDGRAFRCQCRGIAVSEVRYLNRGGLGDALGWYCAGHGKAVPGDVVMGRPVPVDAAGWWALIEHLAADGPAIVGPLGLRFPGLAVAHALVMAGDRAWQVSLATLLYQHFMTSSDPLRRRVALDVYALAPRFFGFENLGLWLVQHAGRNPGGYAPGAAEPDEGKWLRRVVLKQLRGGIAPRLMSAVQTDLLAGWFDPEAIAVLVQVDPHWLLTHAADLVEHHAAWEPCLRDAFAALGERARHDLAQALRTY